MKSISNWTFFFLVSFFFSPSQIVIRMCLEKEDDGSGLIMPLPPFKSLAFHS